MKKTSIIYLVMLIVCGVALWGILRHGNEIAAVADLSGDWTIESDSGPLGPGSAGPEQLGDSFHVEQSGRFFRIRFESGRQLDLRGTEVPYGSIATAPTPILLDDSRWKLKGTVQQSGPKLVGTFTLQGPRPAQFVAYRTPKKTETAPKVVNEPEPSHAPEGPASQPVALGAKTKSTTTPSPDGSQSETATLPVASDSSAGD